MHAGMRCVQLPCAAVLAGIYLYIYMCVREWQIQRSSDLMSYGSLALGANNV